ncbi:PREDICTED: ensconsin-like isoform X16 [Dinoponera quadriceps]|uniref:Ensconsin-like isoform X16 n=1 Tax=Dinoponera quadriceps TaxID=609295 RepID=A0A6P3XEN8_DINQU|nr:PREDICTED: ensconsin-like isoform X16 [Dinoponera quadriceps]
MFSELCRETLRKAAVCYSSARAGSPSPSPPTSPPPSPAKEAKTAANADLANVRDAGHEGARDHQHHSGTSGRRVSPGGNAAGESRDPAAERSTTDRSNDVREYVYVRKRPAMPTDFSKRLPGLEAREGRRGTCVVDPRESRSVSPEKGRQQHEDNNRGGSGGGGGGNGGGAGECGRPDSRLGRRSPGSSPEPEDNSSTSGDEAGAAPEETNQRSSSAHNRHSLTKEQTMHWFAQIGVDDDDALALSDVKRRRSLYDEDSLDGDRPYENEGRDSTGSSKELDRAKLVRERQNEERQRKLEELRQQALAAQRFREQREEERRRRIDELRSRDNDRRNQVEERKRLICEAERERREAILRKNQEREARIEAKKKNERSHIVFAFGSSTPRMLEPADTGGSTFWGTRRATSTTNVMMFSAAQPLTRRSSERELDGSKKRATSAGGLDRKPGEGIRSGEVTPNSPSRPHSSMSQQSASSVGSSNVNLRSRTAASRRPRPASIAGTGVSVTEKHNLVGDVKLTKDSKPPLPKVHSTPKKPSTPKATEVKKPTEKLIKNVKSSPRITPKATPLQSPGAEHAPLIRESTVEIIKQIDEKDTQDVKSEDKNEEKKDQGSEKIQPQESNIIESITEDTKMAEEQSVPVSASKQVKDETNLLQENLLSAVTEEPPKAVKKEENKQEKKPTEISEVKPESEVDEQIDMSASMIAKIRITTEEEAKAALAERRRLAREQAEREAELERQRKEEEARLEAERLRAEEEEQRRLEEETLRLANEAREAEEQRLRLAIEEAKRREEEDRRRREEEARQKQEKEEAERKAREEAERQRIEMSERLKKEEEERNARRKRVEAIMLRTRGKNQSNTPTKGEAGDGDKLKEESPSDENKPVPGSKGDDVMTASLISEATEQFISGEQRAHQVENDAAPDIVHNGTHSNGINESKIVLDNNQGNVEGELNGHHTNHGNGINSQSITLDNATVKQNNVTNNLLDLSEFDTLSNNSSGYDTGPILELTPNLANEDSLNSNLNPTAMPFTPMGNTFVPATANANVNPFQDNFISNKPQDNNQVPDLLS